MWSPSCLIESDAAQGPGPDLWLRALGSSFWPWALCIRWFSLTLAFVLHFQLLVPSEVTTVYPAPGVAGVCRVRPRHPQPAGRWGGTGMWGGRPWTKHTGAPSSRGRGGRQPAEGPPGKGAGSGTSG